MFTYLWEVVRFSKYSNLKFVWVLSFIRWEIDEPHVGFIVIIWVLLNGHSKVRYFLNFYKMPRLLTSNLNTEVENKAFLGSFQIIFWKFLVSSLKNM